MKIKDYDDAFVKTLSVLVTTRNGWIYVHGIEEWEEKEYSYETRVEGYEFFFSSRKVSS